MLRFVSGYAPHLLVGSLAPASVQTGLQIAERQRETDPKRSSIWVRLAGNCTVLHRTVPPHPGLAVWFGDLLLKNREMAKETRSVEDLLTACEPS